MPGRTPNEAFTAFMEPLREAASCLGQVKLVISNGGHSVPDKVHAWTLNGEIGKVFAGGWRFEAQMHYRFDQLAFSKQWKVRTLGYRYQLALQGTHLWRIHWHPTTNSGYDLPHAHINFGTIGDLPKPSLNEHHPTGRMTFEDAIEWVFNRGIRPAKDDWRDILAASRSVHVDNRTWHATPPADLRGG